VTVEQLLWFAYDHLRAFQFAGLPEWVRTDLFMVSAKAAGDDAPVDQIRLMVRSLLEARFGMRAHMEVREIQLRALVWARPGAALCPGVFPLDSCTRKAIDGLRQKFPQKFVSTSTSGGGYGGCSVGFKELAYQLTALHQEPFVDATGLEAEGSPQNGLVIRA
jgi:uncharacterized protein (TIGR03435 family)